MPNLNNGVLDGVRRIGMRIRGAVFDGAVTMVPVTLADAATITVVASAGNQFRVTLAGNRTLGNPVNGKDGQIITFWFIQDSSGGRNLTLGSAYHFGTDLTSVTLSATAGATDRMTCQYDARNARWDITGFLRGW